MTHRDGEAQVGRVRQFFRPDYLTHTVPGPVAKVSLQLQTGFFNHLAPARDSAAVPFQRPSVTTTSPIQSDAMPINSMRVSRSRKNRREMI